jgi:hypothetical protein
MGSHDPFEHLKHKLQPKEGPWIKLAIWLPTIKSQKSPQFPCVQVACDIPLKNSWQKLQLCFKPHLHLRSAHKVMGAPKSRESYLWEFRHICVLVPWLGTKYTTRGKVVASPKFGPWWILRVCVCPWLVHAPTCSNYALTNLLFSFYMSMWVSELLVNLPNPILELQHTLLPPKCYEPRNTP